MSADRRPLAVFLTGPTASGKTALACRLADRFPVQLISVDSALVYRGMDIGTAKPDKATLAAYPHALIDVRDPWQPYSAANFREDALAIMHTCVERGVLPLLVGGTGLYFRALEHGLSPLPQADAAVRHRLSQEAQQIGWPALHSRLARLDPEAARRIGPNDAQRIQRMLEVIELGGGRPFSEQVGKARSPHFPWRTLKLALVPSDRKRLHARIAERFGMMLEQGFLDEVRTLLRHEGMTDDLPAWRAVGYRQARAWLEGRVDEATFRQRAVAATRQLAKRQVTWLRREADVRWIDPFRNDAGDLVMDAVGRFVK